MKRQVQCPECYGTGWMHLLKMHEPGPSICRICHGSGRVEEQLAGMLLAFEQRMAREKEGV